MYSNHHLGYYDKKTNIKYNSMSMCMEIQNFGNTPEDPDIKGMLENSAVAEHA